MISNYMSSICKASGSFLLAFCIYFQSPGQNLEPLKVLNSPYDEQHPVISETGELFFSVGFHPQNSGGPTDYGDIWMSKKNNKGEWTKPVHVPSLSTTGNDVVVGFLDVLTILVYHSGEGRAQGIHQYSKFGTSWNYLRPLQMGNFKNNSIHFGGRLSSDSKVIVMAMNSFGSYGNEDIYVSFKDSEARWSSPLNLGNKINTFAQEQTPFLTADMRHLYFSSNRSEDNRGKDIYVVERMGEGWDSWSEPKPVSHANTKGSEMGYALLSKDEALAIFTTTQNSEGFGDFVKVNLRPDDVLVQATVEEPDYTKPENIKRSEQQLAEVEAEHIETGANESKPDSLNLAKELETAPTEAKPGSSTRKTVVVLDQNTQEAVAYQATLTNERGMSKPAQNQDEVFDSFELPNWTSVQISAKGYIPVSLSSTEWNNLAGDKLYLKPAIKGSSIVLDNIQFNRGTSDFADAKSIQVLDQLVAFLKENESMKIRLEGHTDNAGDPVLNKDLSMKRASKIRGYLTINGIEFERIRVAGWGGTKPVADNSSDEGREKNRRVELLIEG